MSISKQTICLLPSADFISGVSLTHFQPLLHIMLKSLWIEYRPYRRKFYGSSNRHDGEPGTMNINTIKQQFEFSQNFLFRIAKPSLVTNEYFFWLFNFVVVVVLRWTIARQMFVNIEYWYIKFVYCSRLVTARKAFVAQHDCSIIQWFSADNSNFGRLIGGEWIAKFPFIYSVSDCGAIGNTRAK